MTEFDYDCDGNLAREWDANHPSAGKTNPATRVYTYDALDRLTSATEPWGGAGGGTAVTSYGYDAQDHLVSVIDGEGSMTAYTYSDRDLMTGEIYACRPSSFNDVFIFGESVSGIEIKHKPRSNPRWAATTRKNKIIVYTDCSEFFSDTFVVLEEYYHVLRQWNRGRMTKVSYLMESARNGYRGNKFENEAWTFVEGNKSDFDDCLKCPTSAPMGISPGGVSFSGYPR